MLHTAARSREYRDEAAAPPGGVKPGDELRRTAQRLHGALDRMETALAASRSSGAGEAAPLRSENQSLKSKAAQLEKTNARLSAELAEMDKRHAQVAGQVSGISAQLEALIARLSALLEE